MQTGIHTITLADTRIEWYAWGNNCERVKQLNEINRAQIATLVRAGYREGSLTIDIGGPENGDWSNGYWRLAATEVDASLTTFKNLRIRPDGEANYYGLIDGDKWVAIVHLNGEFMPARQEAIMQRIIDALKAE